MTTMISPPGTAPARGLAADPLVRALQIEEVYRFAGSAAAFSYFGAVVTLAVLVDTGDQARGFLWFLFATVVTALRAAAVLSYRRRVPGTNPERWAGFVIGTNVLAGIQWGLLGTWLWPGSHGYREIFTIMTIICYVSGSLTAYSAVRYAHQALTLPATIPVAVYLFFVEDGLHLFAGAAALFFSFAIVYYAVKLHRHLEARFRLQIEHEHLLRLSGGVAERLSLDNRELEHRAAMRGVSMESAREQAERLSSLFLRSPLPMFDCDARGVVMSANAAAERLVGENRGELVGRSIRDHLRIAGRNTWDTEALETFLAHSEGSSFDVEIYAHGVRILRCQAAFTRLAAPQGVKAGFGVILAATPRRETAAAA